jgi:hypothetical protein
MPARLIEKSDRRVPHNIFTERRRALSEVDFAWYIATPISIVKYPFKVQGLQSKGVRNEESARNSIRLGPDRNPGDGPESDH